MSMGVLPESKSLCQVYAWHLWELEGVRCPGIRVSDSCELLCEFRASGRIARAPNH